MWSYGALLGVTVPTDCGSHPVRPVGTKPVKPEREVAVVAQHLVSGGESAPDNPRYQGITGHLFECPALLLSAPVYVVYGKELVLRLPTAGTRRRNSTVELKNFAPAPFPPRPSKFGYAFLRGARADSLPWHVNHQIGSFWCAVCRGEINVWPWGRSGGDGGVFWAKGTNGTRTINPRVVSS